MRRYKKRQEKNKSKPHLTKISNRHINNYLEQHNCYPAEEDWNDQNVCWFEITPQFISLLEDYYVEFKCIPNKLEKYIK